MLENTVPLTKRFNKKTARTSLFALKKTQNSHQNSRYSLVLFFSINFHDHSSCGTFFRQKTVYLFSPTLLDPRPIFSVTAALAASANQIWSFWRTDSSESYLLPVAPLLPLQGRANKVCQQISASYVFISHFSL